MMNWKAWKFPVVMSTITTFMVTFVLVSVNYGYKSGFVYFWMRSWLIAGVMVATSIRFLGPRLRRWLEQG